MKIFKYDITNVKFSICLSLVALNLLIGSIITFIKLPIYLDSIGIVLATVLLGWPMGILCAALTIAIGFFLINPYLPFYTITSLGIVFTVFILRKWNFFSSYLKVVMSGIVVALVSVILSAPVTAYVFRGSTLSGTDAITAYFVSIGKNILNAVLLSGFASEPIDKVIVCIIAYQIFKSIPQSFIEKHDLLNYKK